MKKTMLLLALLALISPLLISCANMAVSPSPVLDRIQQKNELVLGTSGNQPPFSMTTKDGQRIGFDIDIATAMADAVGAELRIETMPFAELLAALETGKVDMVISGLTITPKRNLRVAFVGPYFISGKSILTKVETMAGIDDPADVNIPGMTLTGLKGSTSETFVHSVMPEATFVPAKDYDEAVEMVLTDAVKAMVADYPVCIISVFRHPEAGLVSNITPLSFEPLGIALPQGDPMWLNWVENFLNVFQGTGQLDAVKERWFDDAAWVEQLP